MQLGDRFSEALVYAAAVHGGQARKGSGVPYLAHLLGVASIVLDYGGSEDEAIAALLHDAVEDQGGAPRLAEIRERFGEAVAGIVEGCTDTDVTPKPPWRARKEAYLAHLPGAPPSVLLVSAADKLHNARTILLDSRTVGAGVFERFKGGRDGTLWYYRSLVGIYRAAGSARSSVVLLAEDLDAVVTELETLAFAG
jgi:(p)ppGpp synthase/HD superfamily hydrolase